MHVIKTDFDGNVNVGLYAYATDKYCLIGHEIPKKDVEDIKKILKVPVYTTDIAGTSLLGVFLSGNSNCLLVPEIAFEQELENLKRFGIKYKVIETKYTALGNNILANDNGCLISQEFGKKEQSQIEDALKLKSVQAKIAGLNIIGALAAFNKNGCLLHRDASDDEIALVEKTLKVNVTLGTVNFGSPYIKSGIITNSNGFIIGSLSGGPEIQNADIGLGFVK